MRRPAQDAYCSRLFARHPNRSRFEQRKNVPRSQEFETAVGFDPERWNRATVAHERHPLTIGDRIDIAFEAVDVDAMFVELVVPRKCDLTFGLHQASQCRREFQRDVAADARRRLDERSRPDELYPRAACDARYTKRSRDASARVRESSMPRARVLCAHRLYDRAARCAEYPRRRRRTWPPNSHTSARDGQLATLCCSGRARVARIDTALEQRVAVQGRSAGVRTLRTRAC